MKIACFFRHALATLILLFGIVAFPLVSQATTVRMHTVLGPIDIVLYDTLAHNAVANFLNYANAGTYNRSIVDYAAPDKFLSGGFYAWEDALGGLRTLALTPYPAEYVPSPPPPANVRGKIAMRHPSPRICLPNGNCTVAEIGSSRWFINLGDITRHISAGEYTVFGEVTPSSMATVDAIARLPIVGATIFPQTFGGTVPRYNVYGPVLVLHAPATGQVLQSSNFLTINKITAAPATSYQGLWWNAAEDGWGMSITQHADIAFAAIYTFDDAGQPTWYVMPNCPLTTNRCESPIYKVTGGTSPMAAWNGANKAVAAVGTGKLSFSGPNAGQFDFVLNGKSGSKAITPQLFGENTADSLANYTDIWWNPGEDGWGISMTQRKGIVFAAWYTYDAGGKPAWYVVPSCPVTGRSCRGDIYRVAGGTAITAPWNSVNKSVTAVGHVSFDLAQTDRGTMFYTLNGVTTTREIFRQNF